MSENTAPYDADQVVSDINFTHEVFMKCEDITEFVIPELAVDTDEISERLRGYANTHSQSDTYPMVVAIAEKLEAASQSLTLAREELNGMIGPLYDAIEEMKDLHPMMITQPTTTPH